jgi:hypothetical protein
VTHFGFSEKKQLGFCPKNLPKLLNSGRAGLPAHQRPALEGGLFSSRRSPPLRLSSGAQVNPPRSRLSVWLPNLLRGFREEAHRVAGRPPGGRSLRAAYLLRTSRHHSRPARTSRRVRCRPASRRPCLSPCRGPYKKGKSGLSGMYTMACTGKRTANISMSR